ncbi:hypothetical protein QFZ58_004117 [Streptomyces sp. B1I3]|nr:hypothetical protein [Streptomyces sp. B1I3]
MDAAGVGAQGAVHLREAAHLVQHVVRVAGPVSARRGRRVAVHGIADPSHLGTLRVDLLHEGGQHLAHPAGPGAHHEDEPAGLPVGTEPVDQPEHVVGVASGPSSTASGLLIPEKNSTWTPSSARVRSPIHSRCPPLA